jgi:hypothetical protein
MSASSSWLLASGFWPKLLGSGFCFLLDGTNPQKLVLSLNLRALLLLLASPWMNLEDHPKKITDNLQHSPGMVPGPTDLGSELHFFPGF